MSIVRVQQTLFRFLTDDGTSSGANDTANDYSVTPGNFYAGPNVNRKWFIYSLIVRIRDVTAGYEDSGYGGGSALSNGVKIRVVTGSVGSPTVVRNLVPSDIKKNDDWDSFAQSNLKTWTSGGNTLQAIFDFQQLNGTPLRLDGAEDEKLLVTLEDDLSFLNKQTFFARGVQRGGSLSA